MIKRLSFSALSLRESEILRYAGSNASDESAVNLLNECLSESDSLFSYNACYGVFPLALTADGVIIAGKEIKSKDLRKNLDGCEMVVLLGATVGVKIDRVINKYSSLSPAKAVMFQAIGAEAIEKLCDEAEKRIEKEECVSLRPRFSPGYGDLSISLQKRLFDMLNLTKNLGVCLNDSMLVSPSKSVTALIGLKKRSF